VIEGADLLWIRVFGAAADLEMFGAARLIDLDPGSSTSALHADMALASTTFVSPPV